MKKQASPAPTPRAAALSQSASRFSAGATSAWQRIVGNSPRLAAAAHRGPGAARVAAPLAPPAAPGVSRVALEPQQMLDLATPAAAPETIRQVGWREVDRAVGMSTKRKYNLLGIGFGPKVPVFETEKVKLPVYQETNREKRYYAAVKQEDVARIKREGFQASDSKRRNAAKTVEQFNVRGYIHFHTSEAGAREQGQQLDADYAVMELVLPEYQDFVSGLESHGTTTQSAKTSVIYTKQPVPAMQIRNLKMFRRTSIS